jgi:hypothetical protein
MATTRPEVVLIDAEIINSLTVNNNQTYARSGVIEIRLMHGAGP